MRAAWLGFPILDNQNFFFAGGGTFLTQVGDAGGEAGACGRGALGGQHGRQHRPVRVRICSRTSGCCGIWKEMFNILRAQVIFLTLETFFDNIKVCGKRGTCGAVTFCRQDGW